MADAETCSASRNRIFTVSLREVYRVYDVSVFKEIFKLISSHYSTVIFCFWCTCTKMRKNDYVFFVQKFFAGKVCYVTCNLSALDCVKKICVVYKSATGNVKNTNTVFHLFKSRSVDHSLCIICLWNVNCNVVRVLIDSFKCF